MPNAADFAPYYPSNQLSMRFYDVNGDPIGVQQDIDMAADASWTWVGYASSTPIGSIQFDGDYFVGDDYQAQAVPEPATLGGLTLLRRRRN